MENGREWPSFSLNVPGAPPSSLNKDAAPLQPDEEQRVAVDEVPSGIWLESGVAQSPTS